MSDLGNKKLKAARAEVVRAQVERFRVFYASYFHLEETIPMVEYFFEKIYNLEGREVWLHLAMDTYQKVKRYVEGDFTRKHRIFDRTQ
ncbi:hypothetical protein LEP1GSC044_0133 [Leptospira kirschneri serovar Grippotyphosa str. RM52]|nr:hypothetical protein LEP1GSC044_0133 [Leptospira kirschneri serovar Grippotyphosa str. RM52]